MTILLSTGKIPAALVKRPDQILQVNRNAISDWLRNPKPAAFQASIWVNRMLIKHGATAEDIWAVAASAFTALGMQVGGLVGAETGTKSKAIGYLAIKDTDLGTPVLAVTTDALGTIVTATWQVADCEFRYKNGNQAEAGLRRASLERALQWIADGKEVPDATSPHWMAFQGNKMATMVNLISLSLSAETGETTEPVKTEPVVPKETELKPKTDRFRNRVKRRGGT